MIDYETIRANTQARETERRDREAIEGIQRGNPALAASEAAWLHQRRQDQDRDRAEAAHHAEREAFVRHANTEIDRRGADPRNVEEWKRCLVEVCLGRWPEDSEMLRADPVASLKFQGLRTRLAPKPEDRPRRVWVSNPYFAWS